MTEQEMVSLSSRDFSRPARKWLARLQLAYFSSAWGSGSISSADVEFARDEGDVKTGAVSRRKPFEGLHSEETCLPDDVAIRLNQDGRFSEISSFTSTNFWRLLGPPLASAREAVAFVNDSLRRLGYCRLAPIDEDAWLIEYRSSAAGKTADDAQLDREEIVWQRLNQIVDAEMKRPCERASDCCYNGSVASLIEKAPCGAIRRLVNLEVLALLGGLYRELYLTFELDAADRVGRWFWVLLEEFLSHPRFDSLENEFKNYVVNRILFGRTEAEAARGFRLTESIRLLGEPIGILIPVEGSAGPR